MLWLKAILPATYPWFIGSIVVSTIVLVRIRTEANETMHAAHTHVIEEPQSVVRYSKISNNRVVICAKEEATITCYINPDNTMKQFFIEDLCVDPHTLQSCFDPNELARVEFKNNHAAIVIKLPQMYRAEDSYHFKVPMWSNLSYNVKVESAGLFLFDGRLYIVMQEAFPLFEGRLFTSVDSLVDVVIRLLYRSIFSFEDHLKLINTCSEQLEEELKGSKNNQKLMHLFTLEKSLVYYLNAIGSSGRVITRLMDKSIKKRLHFSHYNMAVLEDVSIESTQCYKMAQIYSQVISGLMDARASVISNNLNIMMKNLNALVISVTVPSFFAGMGGMSEFSAMVGFENWWYVAYPMFALVMAVIGVITFFIIRSAERLYH